MYIVKRTTKETGRIFYDHDTCIIKTPEDDEATYVFQDVDTGEVFYFDETTHINVNDIVNIDIEEESLMGCDPAWFDMDGDEEDFIDYGEDFWTAFGGLPKFADRVTISTDDYFVYICHGGVFLWYDGYGIFDAHINIDSMIHVKGGKLCRITDDGGELEEMDMSTLNKFRMTLDEFKDKVIGKSDEDLFDMKTKLIWFE